MHLLMTYFPWYESERDMVMRHHNINVVILNDPDEPCEDCP